MIELIEFTPYLRDWSLELSLYPSYLLGLILLIAIYLVIYISFKSHSISLLISIPVSLFLFYIKLLPSQYIPHEYIPFSYTSFPIITFILILITPCILIKHLKPKGDINNEKRTL